MKSFIFLSFLFLGQTLEAQTLPDFRFVKTDGTIITKDILEKNKPLIIFYFDPEQGSSDEQAELFEWATEDFEEINMLWVAINERDSEEIDQFYEYYFEDFDLPYASVSKVESTDLHKWFGYSEALTIFVYNAEWQFVERFNHAQTTTTILKNL